MVFYDIRIISACLSAINLENQGIIKQTPSFALKNVKLGVFSYLRNYVEHLQ